MTDIGYTILDALRKQRSEGTQRALCDKYLRLAKQGVNPLHEIIKDYDAEIAATQDGEKRAARTLIREKTVAKAKATGEWFQDYEVWAQTINLIRAAHKRSAEQNGTSDLMDILENYFDSKRDADLYAHVAFLDPVVQKEGVKIENIYRPMLNYGFPRVRDGREKSYGAGTGDSSVGSKDYVFTKGLELLIENLPAKVFADDTHLRKLIRKKADREAFFHFKKSPAEGITFLQRSLNQATNANVKQVLQDVLNTYQRYVDFEFTDENKNFLDPVTREKGGFPSLHQRIAVASAIERKRFGILDGCGTGKTAIGALMFPLVKEKKQREGKKVHDRAVIVGTIPCYKTWKRGFEGDDEVRYLQEKHSVTLINGNGQVKDERLFEEMKRSKVIFANYQQLNTTFKIRGEEIPTYKVLEQLGYDLLVFDEVHNIKNLNEKTAGGVETASAAARHLAMHDSDLYFLLLSGTPMPDNIKDYAMIYHLLQPKACPDPQEFVEAVTQARHNPHELSKFVDAHTIRRTAEEVNDLAYLNREEWYEDVTLTPVQRQLHNYLVLHRPLSWLMKVRKALIDPRLVDKETLLRAGVTQTPTLADSSKYKRLEEIADEAVSRKEKFVVFSSVLKEGITRMNLAKHDGVSLKESLEDHIKKTYGKQAYVEVIDGNVHAVEREDIANRFRDDPNMVGLMCTTDTGGESLDFSFATNAVFLDEDYSPATTEQAIARLWRRGQSKPVNVKFLRGLGTIEATITSYVDKKSLAIKIMLDGHPPTAEEIKLLNETGNHTELTRMITNKFGGLAVDLSKYDSFSTDDVLVRSRGKPVIMRDVVGCANGLDSTRAQQIGMRIGQDKDCWHDAAFVADYVEALHELAPYLASRLRAVDLLSRAQRKEMAFPQRVLSLGSGPGILSGAFKDLADVIASAKLSAPQVHDLDFSKAMLASDKNAARVLADMKELPLKTESYDFVDNASISLLKNPQEVFTSLCEAHRVLKPDGVLELSMKDLYFKDGFHDALRAMGFTVITKPNVALGLSKQKYRELADEHGHGFADACKAKVDNWQLILAKKTADVGEPKVNDLWFMTDVGSEYVPPQHKETASSNKERTPAKRKKGVRRPKFKEDVPKTDRSYYTNKDGTVDFE